VRHEFSPVVKDVLAKRVGFRCSNPVCRQPTSGPQADTTKAVNVGVAAHITAAAAAGPRYDSALTPEERSHPDNGLWLCQNCGKLVDNDPLQFPELRLREWKRVAEEAALREIKGGPSWWLETFSSSAAIVGWQCNYHPCPAGLQNFVRYYLAGHEQDVPFFGGRDRELQSLNDLLHSDRLRYLLVCGKAGLGKSHLLAHWVHRLSCDRDSSLGIIFVPISSRFQTNTRHCVYAMLGSQLAAFFGEEIHDGTRLSEENWRAIAQQYLVRPQPPNNRLSLIVLDGLDEMCNEDLGQGLLPLAAPYWLRVVISARDHPNNRDHWLSRLGWNGQQTAGTLRLSPFNYEQVLNLLQAAEVTSESSIVELTRKLHRLSQGLPLLLRLFVNLLRGRPKDPDLTEADLNRIKPGLAAFFEFWHQRLEERSGPAYETAMNLECVLAIAVGPLPGPDMRRLAEVPDGISQLYRIAWAAMAYFVEGDEEVGYVYSHPEFGTALRQFHARERRDIPAIFERRFLDWGSRELAELRSGARTIEQISSYLIRYYGHHLERATDIPITDRLAVIANLLDSDWCAAWQRRDVDGVDSYSGYLGEIERVLRLCDQVNGESVNQLLLPCLGLEWRCLLIRASIQSLADRCPPELPAALVAAGLWSVPQSLTYISMNRDPHARCKGIRALVSNQKLTDEWRWELLQVARGINEPGFRVEAILSVAAHLKKGLQEEVIHQLILEVNDFDAAQRSVAAAKLAAWISDPERALQLAAGIDNPLLRRQTLLEVSVRLPVPQQAAVLTDALLLARSVENPYLRCHALVDVAERQVDVRRKSEILAEALEAVVEMIAASESPQAGPESAFQSLMRAAAEAGLEARRAYREQSDTDLEQSSQQVAEEIPEQARIGSWIFNDYWFSEMVSESISKANDVQLADGMSQTICTEQRCYIALTRIAGEIPDALWADQVARIIKDDYWRSRALLAVVKRVPIIEQQGIVEEALQLARGVEDCYGRARALIIAAGELLDSSVCQGVVAEAVHATRMIKDSDAHFQVLIDLAAKLSDPQKTEVLLEAAGNAMKSVDYDRDDQSPIQRVIVHLPDPRRALKFAEDIDEPSRRSQALVEVAGRLPEPERSTVLRRSLIAARRIDDSHQFSETLARIVGHFLDGRRALELARSIDSPACRSQALAETAGRLPESERVSVLHEAVHVAESIQDPVHRGQTLATIAPHLPFSLKVSALQRAWKDLRTREGSLSRDWVLEKIAGQVSDHEEAHRIVMDIGNRGVQSRALMRVCRELDGEFRDKIIGRALSIAKSIRKPLSPSRDETLADIVALLPDRRQAYELAHDIESPGWRSRALADVAGRFPEHERQDVIRQALEIARKIQDCGDRVDALVTVADGLPDPERLEVLREAQQAAQNSDHLAKIASRLPLSSRLPVLKEAIRRLERRTRALNQMAPVIRIPEELCSSLASLSPDVFFAEWPSVRSWLSEGGREDLLRDLPRMVGVIQRFGSPACLDQVSTAIQEVATRWP
jgi:hypothetical protein